MSINRFSQPVQNAGYKALSFQELAFAPVQMRQREDALNNTKDEILNQMNNIVGYEGFDEETNAMKSQMKSKLEDLSSRIQKNGVGNINYQDEFRNLRNEYNGLVSKTGALGMSSAVKESMDTQREAYYKLALQNKQSPADIERGWAKEVENYKQNLPSSLSKHKGQLPTFTPAMAPPKQDLAEHASKMVNIMGSFKTEWGRPVFKQRGKDPETGEPIYDVFSENGYDITTEPQVQAMMNILKRDVLDPRSDIHKDLIYRGYTPEEYLSNVDDLGALVAKEAEGETTTYKGPMDNGGSGGSRRSSGGSGAEEEQKDQASLNKLNNAPGKVNHTSTLEEINERQKALELNEEGLNEEDRQREMSALRFAEIDKIKQMDEYKSTPEYAGQIAPLMQKNQVLNAYGVKTLEQYNKIKADYEELKEEASSMPESQQANGEMNSARVIMEELDRQMKTITSNAYAKHASQYVVAPSEQLVLGTGKADDDIRKTLTSIVEGDAIESMAAEGRIEMRMGNGASNTFETVNKDVNNGYETLINDIRTNAVDIKFGAFNTGSEMSRPELQYTITNKKTGVNYDITMALENDDISMDLLSEDGPLYKSLKPADKTKIDAIRDNIVYSGLATQDGREAPNKRWFADDASANVKKHALTEYSKHGLTGVIKSSGVYDDPETGTSLEKYAADAMFIKDTDKEQYAVTINPDKSFSTYKRDADGNVQVYDFEQYMKKGLMKGFMPLNANPKTAGKYHNEYLDTEDGTRYKEQAKYTMIDELYLSITDMDNIASTAIAYNNSSTFKEAMKEYHEVRGRNSTEKDRYEAAQKVYEKIKHLKLQTKQRKLAF